MNNNNDKKMDIGSAFDLLTQRKTYEDFFLRTPCVKSSYLWGVGCGSLMFAHKMRLYRGKLGHAANASLLTFAVVSSISFMVCADEVNRKYEMIRQAMQAQNKIKADPDSRARRSQE